MREIQTIYGVDFSGARDAGNKIWIAKGGCDGGELVIEGCLRARDLPNSGTDIKASLAAIVNLVKSNPNAVFGFDFPFGLPISLVLEKTWEEFVLAFPKKHESPEAFRNSCREACKNRELRRRTDTESRTPFSSYNLRLYKQTYFGIFSILGPLVLGDHARILPMQERAEGKPAVFEICPASTLRVSGLYVPYKGRTEVHRTARESILNRLPSLRPFGFGNERVKEMAIEDAGGDALDSIIAATAAFRALNGNFVLLAGDTGFHSIEGYVFV